MGLPLKEYRFTPGELGERVIFPFSALKSEVNRGTQICRSVMIY